MHNVVTKLISIQKEIQEKNNKTKVIAVSKTFKIEDIIPLINHGHRDFGENKIQEAVQKWTSVKENYSDINLHMIGKIQSNKVKLILPLFEYVHSLDSTKLAEKISEEQKKYKKNIKIFIQVNIGNEEQKSGISPNDVEVFKNKCVNELNLNVIGLMCLPPKDTESSIYFKEMNYLLKKINLKELSMGMSNDYLSAIEYNSSYVRVGSKIFGNRI
ncbi:YggS family pyridoxal phosphate-dependent enzyme [Candidatus Pelagibacter sp.]|jgi:pyridoxal phosphate enzyme (YggS family)|nr:YggS family pyridoxal phosphate-dependent enzyme [Candidatus Pelagibacter sp.]|tara:strand:- start:364 stop:1008 length:645 start_codon:yes stop_codon:yes gene_type:complete